MLGFGTEVLTMTVHELRTNEIIVKQLEGRWVTIYAEVDGEGTSAGSKFKVEKAGVCDYEWIFSL
jgi:hypothetical protein